MALLDTPICDFGWAMPAFELKDGAGQVFKSSDLMGEKGLLVVFMCNHCPYVKTLIERLVADAKALQGLGVNVVGVMSNDYAEYPADSPEKMVEFAAAHGFSFPYLVDDTQAVGKAFGAVCTPDFFGFNGAGELQYRGRLDNVGMNGDTSARASELLDAMLGVAATGQGPAVQTASMGCSIKWK